MLKINYNNIHNIYLGENVNFDVFFDEKVVIIIDDNVNYKTNYPILKIKCNEKNKSEETIREIYLFLNKQKINRKNAQVVAIGGGILLDLVGYACATYMRGLNFISIPTTLLAMVDASIGGKNGYNYLGQKNLIGTFYYPNKVIIDINFLKTLPDSEIKNGISEIIKYGCISDRELIDYLIKTPKNQLDYIYLINKSIEIKKKFTLNDEKDFGKRHALNFGHTYGHAIESFYKYEKYTHGEAIAIGMNMIYEDQLLKDVCQKYGLPIKLEEEIDLTDFLEYDKKNDKKIKFIYLKKLGEVDNERN